MTITFKYEHKDISGNVTTEVEHTTHEESLSNIMQEFRQFLLGIGFQPDSVETYIEAE